MRQVVHCTYISPSCPLLLGLSELCSSECTNNVVVHLSIFQRLHHVSYLIFKSYMHGTCTKLSSTCKHIQIVAKWGQRTCKSGANCPKQSELHCLEGHTGSGCICKNLPGFIGIHRSPGPSLLVVRRRHCVH
jgi:hypothetical protein